MKTELFSRIAAFEFDEGAPEMPFAARLAKDNGWSQVYAIRVIDEYRKFALLTIAAGRIAVPSDQVDQAWHQHLFYTRSWSDFCANALQTILHHDPTRGGESEQVRFKALYDNPPNLGGDLLAEDLSPRLIWTAMPRVGGSCLVCEVTKPSEFLSRGMMSCVRRTNVNRGR